MFVETLIAVLALGTLIGFSLCSVLVADPIRRSRNVLRNRIIEEQLRTYAAQARLTAERMMTERQKRENGQHSLKVVK